MSRRHKEIATETVTNQTQEAAQGAGPKKTLFSIISKRLSSATFGKIREIFKENGTHIERISVERVEEAVKKASKVITDVLVKGDFEVDDDWVKIPRKYFVLHDEEQQEEEVRRGRGRPVVDKLFANVEDSEVVSFFKDAWKTVKKKAKQLYHDVTQYCVCFFKSAFQTFSPYENPCGKLSHYYRLLDESHVAGLPTRKTLNNNYNWFVNWKSPVGAKPKDPFEKEKHKLWRQLIQWICEYLFEIAPQYAVA